jgi:lipopolysaccharide transport system permease protein
MNLNNENIVVYEANYRRKTGFIKIWIIMIKNIISSKELIYQLFKRDFLMSFKKSFLGMTWLFISPIIGIISWLFMNYVGILKPGDIGVPYPVYLLIGTSIWTLFTGFYSSAAGTLSSGSGFIMQVKYPHEALLIKQTAQQLASFLIIFVLNILIFFAFGVFPSWMIILFPLLIIPLFFLGAGLGLIISVVNVVAIDIDRFMSIFFSIFMYLTPVLYSAKIENKFLNIINEINPLTYLIGTIRDLMIFGKTEYLTGYLIASLFCFLFFLFSCRLFYLSEEKVIEKMI